MMIDGPGGDLMIIHLTDKADVIFKGGQGAAAFTDYLEIHTAATTTSLNFRKVGLDLRIESLAGQTVNAGGVTVENYFLTPGLVDYVSSTVGQYDVGYPLWHQLLNYSLVTETLTRPDGFREYIQLDGGAVHPWSSSRHVYDGSNVLHSYSWFMDDGTSGTQSFDPWHFANWSMATTDYDWTGAIARTDILFDDGSRVVTNHAASTATHIGSAGADFLLGTTLNETMSGLEGADTIAGGGGVDWATGGAGADAFGLASGGGWLGVWDFAPSEDRIRVPTTWAGDWTQAQALFSDYQGAAVIRAPDGSTIYLSGISKALLTAASFEFVAV